MTGDATRCGFSRHEPALALRGRGQCVSGASGVAAETGGADERGSSKMSQKHVETL
jgi:hypothetical protein